MTLAQLVVTITIELTAIAVVLIVGAVILKEKEQKQGGVLHVPSDTEFHVADKGPEIVVPLNRYQMIAWIPVEERLPDNTRHVLVSVNYAKGVDSIRIAYWHNQEWQGAIVGKVLAWAELPEPYKK